MFAPVRFVMHLPVSRAKWVQIERGSHKVSLYFTARHGKGFPCVHSTWFFLSDMFAFLHGKYVGVLWSSSTN